jgi:hypothetical protein
MERYQDSKKIISKMIEQTDHFCTKSWEFKFGHLYRIFFEELITTEPRLKSYLCCQHLARFLFSNLARNKDVDVFEDLKKCGYCCVCNKTVTFENNEAVVLILMKVSEIFFYRYFFFLFSFY